MLAANGAVTFVYLIIVVLIIASFWVVFTKANQPGWASLIPIYNLYIMSKMNGRSAVWTIVYLIPLIGQILLGQDVAKSFGQSAGYGIGLWLLPFVFYPMLAFGSATYVGTPTP
jgi:Family of unknown function (DUF5684)